MNRPKINSFSDLMPYERRNEYYSTIQLGKDTREQTVLISKATKALLESRVASTSSIICSQERFAEKVDKLSYGIDAVSDGILGLKASFEFGISEVVWQIEQTREVMQKLLVTNMSPLDTKALERRRRGEKAYAKGLVDDALVDFLASEKMNRYDFAVHISIAMIYTFKIYDSTKAMEYFDKAIKYSKPESAYHCSFSLLHKATILAGMGQLKEAEKAASEAALLSPDFSEAIYQHAIYNAMLSRHDESMVILRKAIDIDFNYCGKAWNETAFSRDHLERLFGDLRDSERRNAEYHFSNAKRRQEYIGTVLDKASKLSVGSVSTADISRCFNRLEELMERQSLADYREVPTILKEVDELQKKCLESIVSSLQMKEDWLKANTDAINAKNSYEHESAKERWIKLMIFGYASLFGGIATLIGVWIQHKDVNSAIGLAIANAIPLIGHINLFAGLINANPFFQYSGYIYMAIIATAAAVHARLNSNVFKEPADPNETKRIEEIRTLISEISEMMAA